MYAGIDSADDAVTKDNADHKDEINDAADTTTTTPITPSVTRPPKASTLANIHESSEEVTRA